MYTDQERRQMIAQLMQACAALLIANMDEQDRQRIFESIQQVIHRITAYLINTQQNGEERQAK